MARLLGPAPDSWAYVLTGGVFKSASGLSVVVYAAASGLTLADIAAYDPNNPTTPGASIAGSTVTVDANSLLPLFWFPDGATTVYVSVNGGPRTPAYANYGPRIDALNTGKVGKGDLVTNVRDYGAKGDGSTDDTAAVQAALNALPINGTLFFPAGNYLCNSALTVSSYVTFLGAGKASRITYSGTGTFITLTNQREVKWENLYFVATGTASTLFSLSNCFRCSWHRCYLNGQFTGPANSGSYLNQIAVVLTANSGDCMFYDCDITNFGIGIKTDCIQNGIVGGKMGTNNVHIYGFGGGGMALGGYVDLVSTPANCDTAIKIDGATGQWWLSNVWIEGCSTAVQIGNNSGTPSGPAQFGATNCKFAATTKILDFQVCRNPILVNVELAGDNGNTATPTPVTLDTTNTPEGVMFADSIVTGAALSVGNFPVGWMVHTRSGSTASLKLPNNASLSYGGALQLARSDNAFIPVLAMTGGPTLLIRGAVQGVTGTPIRFLDSAGNTIGEWGTVASQVNFPRLDPATTGNPAALSAQGTDTNVDLALNPKGTGGVKASGPISTAKGITGSRPSAATAGQGAQWFDTTLNKPIWSDGTNWRDAAGAIV